MTYDEAIKQRDSGAGYNIFASPTAYTSVNDSTGYTFVNQPTTDAARQAQANLNSKIGVTSTPKATPPPSNNNNNNKASGPRNDGSAAYYEQLWRSLGNSGDRPAGWFGPGDGAGNANEDQMISEMYEPTMRLLSEIESQLGANRSRDEQNVETRYADASKQIQGEGEELQMDLSNRQQTFAESFRSALSDAIRAFNSLKQSGQSRYGQGSSVGGALTELAGQEFLRQQGKLTSDKLQGEQQYQLEGMRLKRYVDDKGTQLRQWREDAFSKIAENFQNSMNEIAMRRADTEQNKTVARLNALREARAKVDQIKTAEQNFRSQLATFVVNQLASVQGQNFDPQQIPNILSQAKNWDVSGLVGGSGVQTGGTVNPLASGVTGTDSSEEDELAGLAA